MSTMTRKLHVTHTTAFCMKFRSDRLLPKHLTLGHLVEKPTAHLTLYIGPAKYEDLKRSKQLYVTPIINWYIAHTTHYIGATCFQDAYI